MAIEKRIGANGKPHYRVRVASVDAVTGKRSNRTIGTYTTLKDAKAAFEDSKADQRKGGATAAATASTTVEMAIAEMLGFKRRQKELSDNSYADYASAAKLHINPALGKVKVQKLTREHIATAYTRWQVGGMSARMVQRCHVVLSTALAYQIECKKLRVNVAADKRLKPKVERKQVVTWDASQVAAFLAEAAKDGLHPLWHLLVLEGLRRGEALGLRWQDVDLERGTVHVVQTVAPDKSDKGRAVILPRTKTKAGNRTVKLTRQTLDAIREHKDRQRFQRQAAGDDWVENDLVICTRRVPQWGEGPRMSREQVGVIPGGKPINPNNVTRSYQRIVGAAGVPPIRVHDLRHTAATSLMRAGIPAKIVSDRLGHASVSITLDLYSHVTSDMQDAAAEAMSAILDKASAAM